MSGSTSVMLFSAERSSGLVYSEAIDIDGYKIWSATATVSNSTPAAIVGIVADHTTDELTYVAHGFLDGLKVELTGADLPDGLLESTPYYVIKIDDDRFKLATNRDNALNGIAIDLVDSGSGEITAEPASAIDADIKFQKNDAPRGETAQWADIASATAVDAGGTFGFSGADAGYRQIRAAIIVSSSEATVSMGFTAKG